MKLFQAPGEPREKALFSLEARHSLEGIVEMTAVYLVLAMFFAGSIIHLFAPH